MSASDILLQRAGMSPVLLFAMLISSMFASISVAAPCQFEPMPTPPSNPNPQPVEIGQLAMERVRGATTQTSFKIESGAKGPVKLRWQRFLPPTPLDLQQRLTVSVAGDGTAGFEPYCETGWLPVAQLPNFGELNLAATGPVIWRAEVHEENRTPTLTILEEERATLMLIGELHGTVAITPPPLPHFNKDRVDLQTPIVNCQVAKQAATSDAEAVKSATIAEGGLQIEGTIYARSGRTLHLKVERAAEGPPVRILFSAKPVGYGIAPHPVCAIEVTPGSLEAAVWISATVPWAMITDFRWRITLDSEGTSPTIRYAVYRERQTAIRASDARTHSSDAYSCTGIDIEKQAPVDPLRAAMFQGAYALTIRTNLQGQGMAEGAYRQIVDAILTSIDSWRLVCAACTPYQFSVIDIDGQVYVASGMLHGTPENFRATFIDLYPWAWWLFSRKSTGLFSSALSFVPVSGTARQRQRFCLQKDETGYGFSAAQSPLCRPSPPSSDQEMVVNFEWRPEGLSCDNRSSVVACWNGTDLIELNLKDYSFYVGDTGDSLVGTAAKGADLVRVFAHEVGHWLGLDHIAGDGNIMSDELSAARCIDDYNVRQLNAIALGEMKPSKKPEALLYE